MNFKLAYWIKYAFFNLAIVSCLGFLLRYKIAFSLPLLDQKHLLHAHSHFAFSGWVSHTLIILMVAFMQTKKAILSKNYHGVIIANLVSAYGMLICFSLQGYGFWSILFSTLSIVSTYVFTWMYWKDLNSEVTNQNTRQYFKMALIGNFLSSLGAFFLAYLMVSKSISQNLHLGAVYFFLHFQYNGWFFFACLGLLMSQLETHPAIQKKCHTAFLLMAGTCIPSYFLSILWAKIPPIFYGLIIVAAIGQFWGWILFLKATIPIIRQTVKNIGKTILLLTALAFSIKFILQLGSTIPELSKLAFGFRPIIIGYLHLVLLGGVSIFLFGFLKSYYAHLFASKFNKGIFLFIAGILFNELFLLIQGVAAIAYFQIPHINLILWLVTILLVGGATVLNQSFLKKDDNHA